MQFIEKLYTWYGKRTVQAVAGLIIVLTLVVIFTGHGSSENTLSAEALLPTVAVATADQLQGNANTTLIGTVEAVNEAEVETEAAGRVISVAVELGDTVRAGQLLVQLENSAEAAAVLQAEGSYEAALAAAAQSDLGVNQAQTAVTTAENNVVAAKDSIINVNRSVYTTVNQVVVSTLDQFFSNPDGTTPGVRINKVSNAIAINQDRVVLQTLLADFRTTSNNLTRESDLLAALDEAEQLTRHTLSMVDEFLVALPNEDPNDRFTTATIATAISDLTTDRTTLNAQLSAIDTARTTLSNAERSVESANESLRQAEIGGTNAEVSAANAQVKQALGALRSAQANLAKKSVRSPIAGVVNKIDVNPGDFLAAFTPVAIIANNNALEITTFVGEQDRSLLEVGQTVEIEGGLTGVVTRIAPAVDPVTKKIEVHIGTEGDTLTNGDTVSVTISGAALPDEAAPIMVPLSTVRFTAEAGFVFTVENNELVSHPVELGVVRSGYVEITDGVSRTMELVVDARGLAEGQKVEAVTSQ